MGLKAVQTPVGGRHRLMFRGDVVEFEMKISAAAKGKAFLRTNLENGALRRREIIANIDEAAPFCAQDWHDIQMVREGDSIFRLRLALLDIGHFEGKCFFLPAGEGEPVWPEGGNVHVNVEPAEYCCANTIYCAFIRQFGPNRQAPESLPASGRFNYQVRPLDDAGVTVIPPSGTFREFRKHLDFIIDGLNCRVVHLLPINPTPTVFARMGRFGSPYAALDFTAVDPAMAEFDRQATPLEQFLEVVDDIHRKNAKVFLDIAINHTGWAAKIHEEHPEWLMRGEDGTIVSPGAWGTVWEDLTELDHRRVELWRYLAEVFLVWCRRGVDGFRCDAGYMVPERAWTYIIAKVREQYPATIFLLEGLGGDPKVTRSLLNTGNMNWAYSELFQNYSRGEIVKYIGYANEVGGADGLMVHYAETHDNLRLAAESPTYSRMRVALCAMLSQNGAFGFANGVEWFAREKIDVHDARALNWDSSDNQVEFIARLNTILIAHPAFHPGYSLEFLNGKQPAGKSAEASGDSAVFAEDKTIAFLRRSSAGVPILVIINLDHHNSATAKLSGLPDGLGIGELYDLFKRGGAEPAATASGGRLELELPPGGAVCLSANPADKELVDKAEAHDLLAPERKEMQRARAAALDVICWKNRSAVVSGVDFAEAAETMLKSPKEFLGGVFGHGSLPPVVVWQWPRDLRRTVLAPPHHLVMALAPWRFRVALAEPDGGQIIQQRDSLESADGTHFAFITALPERKNAAKLEMRISVYDPAGAVRQTAKVLVPAPRLTSMPVEKTCPCPDDTFLATNGRGGMTRPSLAWGELRSRYDAFLAANLNPDYPEDRHVMWRRCRAWILFQGRSVELCAANQRGFFLNEAGGGSWRFRLPCGNGLLVDLLLALGMDEDENTARLTVERPAANRHNFLGDQSPLRIIVRPDIEDRNFHQETKAAWGPEKQWPGAVSADSKSFTFAPDPGRKLRMAASRGGFHSAPEWYYNLNHPKEADRGLEANSDLFSPGYFEIELFGGDIGEIVGAVNTGESNGKTKFSPSESLASLAAPRPAAIEGVMLDAIRQFVVRRHGRKTVIAGYPWFLDWGRDTLICARGMIAAGMLEETQDILLQFARFAKDGTLPNMIHGDNADNRDTTDAPLWFFTVCRDLRAALPAKSDPLKLKVDGGGTLLDTLVGLAEGYLAGTPNGIKVDAGSGLVYSPPHFTWMDTNYPAASPRQGYPIEIQALWHAALRFLHEATGDKHHAELADKVRESVRRLFVRSEGWLSDCLHGGPSVPASIARRDDHLRPNQLFAVTLGLIDDQPTVASILEACSELLVPGAIRSLADRPVEFPLVVKAADGTDALDRLHPYHGCYQGDEDTRRKPAYHNGTAWTWQFPSYAEAMYLTYGEPTRKRAAAILASAAPLLRQGCFGHMPEIVDGDYPHQQRGCDAQAWGITELYRVWKIIGG